MGGNRRAGLLVILPAVRIMILILLSSPTVAPYAFRITRAIASGTMIRTSATTTITTAKPASPVTLFASAIHRHRSYSPSASARPSLLLSSSIASSSADSSNAMANAKNTTNATTTTTQPAVVARTGVCVGCPWSRPPRN